MPPGAPQLADRPVPADDAVPEYMRALERAASYLSEDQRRQLRRAWVVGAAAHAGQTRRSGEPYITHPVAVAAVLAEQRVDVETLVAAILHDTLEDTPLTRAAIVDEFGETVAELVDGVALREPSIGDLLAVPVTGAYCYTMSNQYNGARRVPVMFTRAGAARLVVRRDTWPALERHGIWSGEFAYLRNGVEVPLSALFIAHRDASGAIESVSSRWFLYFAAWPARS